MKRIDKKEDFPVAPHYFILDIEEYSTDDGYGGINREKKGVYSWTNDKAEWEAEIARRSTPRPYNTLPVFFCGYTSPATITTTISVKV